MANETELRELMNRLDELESKEEIRNLRHKYAYYVDDRDWERFLSLFTDDACIEYMTSNQSQKTYQGIEEIQEFTRELDEQISFTAHMVHNPVITIDDDGAQGEWYFEVPELTKEGLALWVQGKYKEDYIQVDGEWKFSRIEILANYSADYQAGWAGNINQETTSDTE